MKKSTLLLIISTAIFFTSTLVLLYLNYLKPTPTSTPTTGIIPTDSPIPTTDPVVDWKTYTNKEYSFEFKYPKEFTVSEKITSGETGQTFNLSLNKGQNSRILLGGITSDYSDGRSGTFTDTQGYLQTQEGVYIKFVNNTKILISPPLLQSVTKNQNNIEIVRVAGQAKSFETMGPGDPGKDNFGAFINLPSKILTGIAFINQPSDPLTYTQFDQLLSTFKFISPTPTPTKTVTLTKVKILDSSAWTEHSCGPISYKIPAEGYDIKCFQDDATSFNVSIANKGGFGNVASIQIRQYDGGSRRQYWIKGMGVSDAELSKYVRFQESLFGNVSGLDVFASGGWWQGGYASPILIANGKTIVSINGGRDFDDTTGKISRWDFTDTIASTIKFINP